MESAIREVATTLIASEPVGGEKKKKKRELCFVVFSFSLSED